MRRSALCPCKPYFDLPCTSRAVGDMHMGELDVVSDQQRGQKAPHVIEIGEVPGNPLAPSASAIRN